MRAEVVPGERLADLRLDWLALLPEKRWGFFLHPDWFRIARESYYPASRAHLHLAYEGDRIVGILPTIRRRMNRFGLYLPVMDAFVGGRGDYSVPLTGPSAPRVVVRTLLDSALRSARGAGTLVLANLPVETGVPAILEELLLERGLSYQRAASPCLTLSLPASFAEAEAAMKKTLRGDLRRQAKRIAEAIGPLDFQVIHDPAEAAAHLPDLFMMHDRRWLEAGVPTSFEDPAARAFYYRTIEEFAGKGLHFSLLRAGDRVIAYHMGVVWGGALLYYKPTFDHTLQNFSPGKLHLRYLLEEMIREGVRTIDFLQGTEAYKSDWASEVTECATYTVRTRPFSASYGWLTRGRPWSERTLGPLYNRWSARLSKLRSFPRQRTRR